jgi:RNA polymerase sigma factor (sigma-70 family)
MKEKEFLILIESHKGILHKVTNAYCKEEADREDLVQEIILQLWKSYSNYNPEFKLSTWIYRISLNVAISYYRKNIPTRNALALEGTVLQKANSIEYDEEPRLKMLNDFIAQLDDLNKALMLLYLEEKSLKEISEIIGISESNVGTKISRIKQKLKEKFQSHNE